MTTASRGELPIIQATMDLIQWFVPLLNRLPRDHRFALGDRLVAGLYDLLKGLVAARYEHAGRLVEDVGRQLGGWISQQRRQSPSLATS